jgi:putative ABC transport system permease protein
MSKATYENLYGEDYKTNVVFTQNKELSEEKIKELTSEIISQNEISAVSDIDTTMKTFDDMMASLNYVVIILIVSAGLLAFVVLYNLANVNISERIRELATIKVLGFYDKEVYEYVTRETVILTIIGIALGLIGGYFLNYFIIGTCEINMLKFAKVINPISYVYAVLITVAFTLIVNFVTYFALKKIDMIESLKSVE